MRCGTFPGPSNSIPILRWAMPDLAMRLPAAVNRSAVCNHWSGDRNFESLDPFIAMYGPVAQYMALFALEDYEQTVKVCRAMAARHPNHAGARRLLTVSLGLLRSRRGQRMPRGNAHDASRLLQRPCRKRYGLHKSIRPGPFPSRAAESRPQGLACKFHQVGCDAPNDASPISVRFLPVQFGCRIPGTIGSIEEPSPAGIETIEDPDRLARNAGQMRGGGYRR